MTSKSDSFGSKNALKVGGDSYTIYRLDKAASGRALTRLPVSLRILLENQAKPERSPVLRCPMP